MQPAEPVVSILIPNYNNGRESSKSGDRDFIDDLLRSIAGTLEDDPTPVEILIDDDGSSDDSLETCRDWTGRTWRGGQPFCRLDEHEHGGVLSVVANRLTAAARGRICCRLDGDIVILTPRWAERIVAAFDGGPPTLGIVGPKQLTPDGRVHAAGDWVLHPRGYRHIAQGAAASSVRHAREVDHVMGCFYCHRREIWEELGGYDETILRGQTVDFGLRARLQGWRAFAVPDVEFIHAHALRSDRPTTADTRDGIQHTLDRFAAKWGFDRVAPDLDMVAARYRGTPLLWNARVFGPAQGPADGPAPAPRDIRDSDWARYTTDEDYRAGIDLRVQVARIAHGRNERGGRVVDVGCGCGLVGHLLAQRGIAVTGVDWDPSSVDLARRATDGERYPGPRPEFKLLEGPGLPLADGSAEVVLVFDVLETHANPVGLMFETWRVLAGDGLAAFVVRKRTPPFEIDDESAPAYHEHELLLQMRGSRCFSPMKLNDFPEIPGALTFLGARRNDDPRAVYGAGSAADAAGPAPGRPAEVAISV